MISAACAASAEEARRAVSLSALAIIAFLLERFRKSGNRFFAHEGRARRSAAGSESEEASQPREQSWPGQRLEGFARAFGIERLAVRHGGFQRIGLLRLERHQGAAVAAQLLDRGDERAGGGEPGVDLHRLAAEVAGEPAAAE